LTNRSERFEISLDATPEEVWQSLTTGEGLASWFGQRAAIDFRPGGVRVVGWGDDVEIVAKIAEIEPERFLKLMYMQDGVAAGAEEWQITTDGNRTHLTLVHSMPDDGIDDWEGFYGDIRRGWGLFLNSLRHGLEDADRSDRTAECRYLPAPGARDSVWEKLVPALDGRLVQGLRSELIDPPNSMLLTAPDRTLLLDLEGSAEGQVLYAQAATHGGPDGWRSEVLDLVSSLVS
jgi:uncharacterized protein YndB with AHSA1/START domain